MTLVPPISTSRGHFRDTSTLSLGVTRYHSDSRRGSEVIPAPGTTRFLEHAGGVRERVHDPAAPIDLPSLAGTWHGTASGPQGSSQPITMRIAPDGAYSTDGGVYTAQGTAQVKDGELVLTPTSTTGGQTAGRVATAVFSEKRQPSQVIQVLTGSGASSSGPYSFEVSRPKQ